MKRWIALLLCTLMLSSTAYALENAYLSGEDLQKLEPAYEAFLDALADVLIAKSLLDEAERDAWILYQRGDFLQNGGFGTIAVLYTPGLLSIADESVTMRRMSAQTQAGTLWLETLQRYATAYSPLPGLPLDAELLDDTGMAVACRFRWIASDGSFMIWDGAQEELVNVGATFINDGRPLYWFAEPVNGIEEQLTLELLHPKDDITLAVVILHMLSGEDFWAPEVLK